MAIEKKFKILIYPGLHSRPGTDFVKFVSEFEGNVEIKKGEKSVDGRSIIALFTLLPKQFEEITIKINGEGEEQFMDKIRLWETAAFLNEEDYLNENVDESILKVFKEVD
jgi:phosphotransferase system HPr (HPr) family protein